MPKGGRRPGAGRRPGSKNRRTESNIVRAAQSGEMPLDMILRYMRGAPAEHFLKDHEGNIVTDAASVPVKFKAPLPLKDQLGLAQAAAPYLHPRLANINHEGGIDLKSLPDEVFNEFHSLRRKLEQIAAGSMGPGGGAPRKAKAKRRG